MNIDADDPRLTAYALGELTGPERDEIGRAIEASPALRAEVQAIRQAAQILTDELAAEPVAELTPRQTAALRARTCESGGSRPAKTRRAWWLAPLAAAAAVALAAGIFLVAIHRPAHGPARREAAVQPRPAPPRAPAPAWPAKPGLPRNTGPGELPGPITEGTQAPGQPAPVQQERLDLKLPKPIFIGTPQDIRVPDLEPPRNTPRPPVYVPAGTTNLALHKKVTSSDPNPIIGKLSLITDGNKSGRDGSYVELGPGRQWVQIDLGKMAHIYVIVVWHYHAEARVYHDVVVQTADDKDFIQNVRTVFNNDRTNSAGLGIGHDRPYIDTYEGKLIQCKKDVGRYVRLYSQGNTSNDQNDYVEVEVYGKWAK